MQGTKKFHEEYFESKKNRDKMLANARRDVDKSHKEVKGSDKPKAVRGVNAPNPMQDIINKEAGELSRHKNTVRIISFFVLPWSLLSFHLIGVNTNLTHTMYLLLTTRYIIGSMVGFDKFQQCWHLDVANTSLAGKRTI